LQHWRVEALGEPAIDRCQEIAGFRAFALIAPEAGEASRGTKLKRFCALPLRDGECEMIVLLGRDPLARRVQQIASQPMQLGLAVPLVGRLDDLRGLSEAIQALHRLSKLGVGLGKHRERHGGTNDSSSTTTHCKSLREQLNAFLVWPSAVSEHPWYIVPQFNQNGKPCSFERATTCSAYRCMS
jgi:hypothetical protein